MSGVEQWRTPTTTEIQRSGYPLPVDLVLAVMKRESSGRVGVRNPRSGASGLMQVMPIALTHYNNEHRIKYTMADLRSDTDEAALIQIRVGLWILAFFWRSAYRYLKSKLGQVPLDDLVKTADFFYAAGPGNARRKLDRVSRPTFQNVKARFPNWDRIAPAQLVWDRSKDAPWDMSRIENWIQGEQDQEDERTGMGAALGLALIAIAWWYFEKGQKK